MRLSCSKCISLHFAISSLAELDVSGLKKKKRRYLLLVCLCVCLSVTDVLSSCALCTRILCGLSLVTVQAGSHHTNLPVDHSTLSLHLHKLLRCFTISPQLFCVASDLPLYPIIPSHQKPFLDIITQWPSFSLYSFLVPYRALTMLNNSCKEKTLKYLCLTTL